MAKKAAVTFTRIDGETTLVGTDKRGRKVAIHCARFEVGTFHRTNGWSFVARLEHTPAGNLIACATGEELDPMWRTAKAVCDHCATKRARRDTFVLRGPEGEVKQIGRNCLADFLMCDATSIVHQAEFVRELAARGEADEESYSGSSSSTVATVDVVAYAIASIEKRGYRKVADDGSTKQDVNFLMGDAPNKDRFPDDFRVWLAGQPTDAERAKAELVVAWAKEQEGSDYLWNIRTTCAAEWCDFSRYAGIVASIPVAYDRAMGEARKASEKPVTKPSEFVGTAGKRETFNVVLEARIPFDTQYGQTMICIFADLAGNRIVWFASGSCPSEDDKHKEILLTGTVKKHDVRKGVKQTSLTRCKWEIPE